MRSPTTAGRFKAWATARTGAAGKVFREFKWGLLTLLLLMAVVVSLVWSGGDKEAEIKGAKSVSAVAGEENGGQLPPDIAVQPSSSLPPPEGDVSVADTTPPTLPPEVSAAAAVTGDDTGTGVVGEENIPEEHSNVGGDAGSVSPAPLREEAVPPEEDTGEPAIAEARPENGEGEQRVAEETAAAFGDEGPVEEDFGIGRNNGAGAEREAAASPVETEKTITVKPGDALEKIARRLYAGRVSAGVRALISANKDRLSDPNRLQVGQVLRVPVLASSKLKETDTGGTTGAVSEPKSPAPGEYVVRTGDTLERIARRCLGSGRRWSELYELNRDRLSNPHRLRVGQVLKLPKEAASSLVVAAAAARNSETGERPLVAVAARQSSSAPAFSNKKRVRPSEKEGKDESASAGFLARKELPVLLNKRSPSAPAWMP